MTCYTHPSMEISELLAEAITKHRNTMPLPHTLGAPIFRGPDVTAFLHKYESLARFTGTDPSSKDVISMFPYYCAEGSDVRETVMLMHRYANRDWATFKTERLDAFRHSDSRALVYTRRYLEELCTSFGGRHKDFGNLEQIECLKSFLTQFDHISGVLMARGMTCEYERTEMLLHTLPKKLWKKAISKLGMHPLEPSTFNYHNLNTWISARITAAEALAMFELMAPKSPAATDMTSTSSGTAFPMTLTAPTVQPTAPMTSENLTTLTSPTTPAAPSTILTTPTAPIASTAPIAPTAFTPSTHTTSLAFSICTAHTAPTLTMAAKTLITPTAPTTSPAPTAPVPLMTSGTPTTSPPKQGPQARRRRFVNPHRVRSTIPCRQKPAHLNRPNDSVPPYHQKPALPHCHVEQQPCYYCADDHNSRKCTDLHADLEKGLISINDKSRLMFGHTCSEIPMEPAIRDYCTMRDCARAEAWLLLPPSPPSPPPARSVLSLSPPPPPPPPAQSSRIPTPLVSPEQLTQLVREVVEHFTQPRPKQIARPPPAA
ncbi:hypothetical protein K440DRAFT_269580 [Wilcoxina mikolae CBS 423.85]|nr:hypothetical protein K440DRAFT_269580 [Wilcoxina mikolae CBS 423.85]